MLRGRVGLGSSSIKRSEASEGRSLLKNFDLLRNPNG